MAGIDAFWISAGMSGMMKICRCISMRQNAHPSTGALLDASDNRQSISGLCLTKGPWHALVLCLRYMAS